MITFEVKRFGRCKVNSCEIAFDEFNLFDSFTEIQHRMNYDLATLKCE